MDIGVLIGIMIAIVVGVSVIPVINSAINSIDTSGMNSATVGLLSVFPVVVVVLIVLGAVGFIVNSSSSSGEKRTHHVAVNYPASESVTENPIIAPESVEISVVDTSVKKLKDDHSPIKSGAIKIFRG